MDGQPTIQRLILTAYVRAVLPLRNDALQIPPAYFAEQIDSAAVDMAGNDNARRPEL